MEKDCIELMLSYTKPDIVNVMSEVKFL